MSMSNLIHGIDVSRWQGTDINWNMVKSDGYQFTFIKASDGSAYKRQFIEMGIKQANEAKNAGLKIGYYHFSHPSNFGGLEQDAKDEANFFLETIDNFPKANFPAVIDLEDARMNLAQRETEEWIEVFKTILINSGIETMLYSSKRFLDRNLPSNHQLGIVPLWLAIYPRNFDINKHPRSPIGWSSWDIWQYGQGKIKGDKHGAVDLNLMKEEFYVKKRIIYS